MGNALVIEPLFKFSDKFKYDSWHCRSFNNSNNAKQQNFIFLSSENETRASAKVSRAAFKEQSSQKPKLTSLVLLQTTKARLRARQSAVSPRSKALLGQ
jgi:hypothetical protein